VARVVRYTGILDGPTVEDDFETMQGPTGPSPARWYVLVTVMLLNVVLALFRSAMPTAYTSSGD